MAGTKLGGQPIHQSQLFISYLPTTPQSQIPKLSLGPTTYLFCSSFALSLQLSNTPKMPV